MVRDNFRYIFSNILLTIGVVAPICLLMIAICEIFG